jgi:heptosyltransferase-2
MLASIFVGRATRFPLSPSKVIVVLTGKLGDIVCGTPVLRALREHVPGIKITLYGDRKLQEALLSDSGLVDTYLDSHSTRVEDLKKLEFDAAFVTGPSFEPVAKLFLARIPLVVAPRVEGGFSPAETRLYKILKKFIVTFPYRIDNYAPRERLRVLESIGIHTDDTNKLLGFSNTAKEKVDTYLKNKGIGDKDFIVGISPSAGNKIKEWPTERFAQVANHINEKYKAVIIIIGGPGDKEMVGKVASSLEVNVRHLEITDFNIDELKALISRLKIFVAVDTGPIYIAEAFGIPTIDIVGPVDERVQPPRGERHINVIPPYERKPQLSILNARAYDAEEATRQSLSITVEMVNTAIDKLVALL